VIDEPSPGSSRRSIRIHYTGTQDIDVAIATDVPVGRKPLRNSTPVPFDQFYSKELAALIRFVRRYGADAHTAADVVQDAFTEAYRQWDSIENPHAWLRKVASRMYYRGLLCEIPVQDAPDRPLIYEDTVEAGEQGRQVFEALAALPERQRQVMAWHLDGYSHAEIAAQLGISQAASRQNFHRARRALKLRFGLSHDEQEGETQ
jgi:RNA polymerase sigma-70 factor (ECF subfamily)